MHFADQWSPEWMWRGLEMTSHSSPHPCPKPSFHLGNPENKAGLHQLGLGFPSLSQLLLQLFSFHTSSFKLKHWMRRTAGIASKKPQLQPASLKPHSNLVKILKAARKPWSKASLPSLPLQWFLTPHSIEIPHQSH